MPICATWCKYNFYQAGQFGKSVFTKIVREK